MVSEKDFGFTIDGRKVKEYVLDNGNIRAHILNYGCIIRMLEVKDKNGNFRDVVLGYDDVKGYEANGGYLGAFIGRVANRTGDGKFTLNGKTYKLFNNDGKNSLHGGKNGFNTKIFDGNIEGERLTLSTVSPDGDENFPGNLEVSVTYYLDENGINIEYNGLCDKDTPINLTNHSYFNLSGEEQILNHLVTINSDYITPVDKNLIPTGQLLHVEDTPFDFNKREVVGKRIDYAHRQIKLAGGYDHNYVLKNYTKFEKVASLYSKESGINMDVYTDTYGMQFYTGNFLNNEVGKGGKIYQRRGGVCFETQNFPNAINQVSFPSAVLKKGEKFFSHTAYRFCLKED